MCKSALRIQFIMIWLYLFNVFIFTVKKSQTNSQIWETGSIYSKALGERPACLFGSWCHHTLTCLYTNVAFVTATILTLLLKDSVMALLLYNVKLLNYLTVRTRICMISYNLIDYVQHTLKLPRCQFHLFLLLLCCCWSPYSLLLSLYHCLSHSPLFPSLSVYYSVHHLQ